MGHGIAQVLAQAGVRVRLRDVDRARVDKGLAEGKKNLEAGVAKGKLTAAARDSALGLLTGEIELAAAVAGADVVIEAIPEDLELKKKVLAEVSRVAHDARLVATNTSSLPVTEIAQATDRP